MAQTPSKTAAPNFTMKQNGVRNTGCVVDCMKWSNKMDLLAYGNAKGEVTVQRLNWQKILTHPPVGEDVKVRSLSWQGDATLLAIGYSNGRVSIIDVETEEVVSVFNFKGDIHSVYFSKAISVPDYRKIYKNRTELTYDFFLPQLPVLNNVAASSKVSEEQKSFTKGAPCFLVVVQNDGLVQLLVMGALKAGTIDISQFATNPNDFEVFDIFLGGNFDTIFALIRDKDTLKLLQFQNEILKNYLSPLLQLAVQCSNVLEARNYINDTIQCMTEAWETVLMEMDNKLTKYANAQTQGSLSADFLELLVFGYATHDIEEFLMDDLTEKGLKKLANSVDLSFSTIQSLVTKPLQAAGVNMFYFMNTIKGLAQICYFFEPLVAPEAAEYAMRMCGAFLMKILELQQVIDQSVNDTKLFFCWLCVVIMRLHQQDMTDDLTTETPEDTIYLAEYLNGFEDCIIQNEDGTMTKRKFNLEKIGQYFENKPLFQVPKTDVHNLWGRLLDENECLRNSHKLSPHCKETSLIQQRDQLLKSIDDVFEHSNQNISTNFKISSTIILAKIPNTTTTTTTTSKTICGNLIRSSFRAGENGKSHDTIVTTINWQDILIFEFIENAQNLKCTRLTLKPGPFTPNLRNVGLENLHFVDLEFYNSKTISCLVKNINDNRSQSSHQSQQCFLLQLDFEILENKHTLHILTHKLMINEMSVAYTLHENAENNYFKPVDGNCSHLTVSGTRKVATILSDDRKTMTIFEMEVEEEDEDTENSYISPLEASKESNFA